MAGTRGRSGAPTGTMTGSGRIRRAPQPAMRGAATAAKVPAVAAATVAAVALTLVAAGRPGRRAGPGARERARGSGQGQVLRRSAARPRIRAHPVQHCRCHARQRQPVHGDLQPQQGPAPAQRPAAGRSPFGRAGLDTAAARGRVRARRACRPAAHGGEGHLAGGAPAQRAQPGHGRRQPRGGERGLRARHDRGNRDRRCAACLRGRRAGPGVAQAPPVRRQPPQAGPRHPGRSRQRLGPQPGRRTPRATPAAPAMPLPVRAARAGLTPTIRAGQRATPDRRSAPPSATAGPPAATAGTGPIPITRAGPPTARAARSPRITRAGPPTTSAGR